MQLNFYKLLIISFLILNHFSLFSQNGTLKGIILDGEDNQPLINATIKVANFGTVTDVDGVYQIELPAGEYTVQFRYVGYKSEAKKISISAGKVTQLNITLGLETNVLQTATVTSGKFEKPLGEVTVSLEVLKPGLIESTNTTSVDQVISKIPGVTIVDGQANIRGGSGWSYGAGSRVLLLVDDIPALQADAGFPNWNDIAIENIEQIEVVKGAASALYGSSALNGIINIRTAYAKSKPVTKVSTFQTFYLSPKDAAKKWWNKPPRDFGYSLAHRQKFGKLDVVFGGYFFDSKSFNEKSERRFGRVNLGTRYRINDRLSIGFNSNFNLGKSMSPFVWRDWQEGAYRAPEDASSNSATERLRYFIDPFVTWFDKADNKHRFLGRLYNINNKSNDNRSNKSSLRYGEYQFQRKFEGLDAVLTTGIVGINTFIDAELYGDTTYTSNNLSGYVQLEKKFFDKLNISFGARYERNTTKSPEIIEVGDIHRDTIPNGKISEGKPVFRVGANYEVSKATYVRASWGEGYRYPTIAEQFIFTDVGFLVLPNPKLTSETGWTAEVGIKQGVAFSDWKGFADLAFFWSEYQDMMEFGIQVLPPFLVGFQSSNVGNTVIKGIDLSIGGQGKIGSIPTSITTGYTYIDPKYKKEFFTEDVQKTASHCQDLEEGEECENILKYRSKHSFKIDIQSDFDPFFIGFSTIYNSKVTSIDQVLASLRGVAFFRAEHDRGYTKMDIRAGVHINENSKISFLVNNLLNEEYTERPGLLTAPRNISVRADFTF